MQRTGLLRALASLAAFALAACATVPPSGPERIQILAINDFHGNLEVLPGEQAYRTASGETASEQLGGAARLGATLSALRAGRDHSVTVAAGDLIGATPLVSAYYLDEPTIMALNRMGLEIAAVGNHEFDKGVAELRRMQEGGCNEGRLVGARQPCLLDNPFEGARFTYLAANVVGPEGKTLFPASVVRRFGAATVGFVGMTLKETGILTSPGGTVGYTFEDEADTANAEAARLREAGADAVVLLIHQGAYVDPDYNETGCPGLDGALLPVLRRLDPAIRLVVSGHTHRAYVCEVPASDGTPRLLTSAGRYGFFVTEIELTVDPRGGVTSFGAVNRPVAGANGEQADIAALVARYAEDVAQEAAKVIGRIDGSLAPASGAFYRPIDYLVADAQFAATRSPEEGGAQFALMNYGGIRTTFQPAPDGSVTYGQAFALQPFGNTLSVVELTGAELIAGLEAALAVATPGSARSRLLVPSHNLHYAFDLSRPAGSRLLSITLDGRPLDPSATYRVTANNFIAAGGDGFGFLAAARPVAGGGLDLDALAAYLARGVAAPAEARVEDRTPAN